MYTTQVTLLLYFRHGLSELYIHLGVGEEKLWHLTLKTEYVTMSLFCGLVGQEVKFHNTLCKALRDSGTKRKSIEKQKKQSNHFYRYY